MTKPSASRNVQLDVLRGVAIVLVLGRHLELPRPEGILGVMADAWFRVGWIGVDLFFVLSGFLIGGLLIDELRRRGKIDIARFLIRRGFKIYPAYVVFVAYLMAMPTLKASIAGRDGLGAFVEQWLLYWPNLVFLQNYIGTNPAGHTWSLAVEEHFYLSLPFLIAWLGSAGRLRLIAILCGVSGFLFLFLRVVSVATDDAFAERMAATHLRLDALLCGVGLRALAAYSPNSFGRGREFRIVLVVVGLLCWSPNLFIEPSGVFVRTVGLTGTYVGAAALLWAAFLTRGTDFGDAQPVALMFAKFMSWIGIYSYAIYLWHTTAMGILEREAGARILAWAGGASGVAWLFATVVVCGRAIVVGAIASRAVEWPVIRVRDRLFPSNAGALDHLSRAGSDTSVLRTRADVA